MYVVIVKGKLYFATLTWLRHWKELNILVPADTRDCVIVDKIASKHKHFLASILLLMLGRKI